MNDNFCSLPWTGIDIDAQGMVKPCCKYLVPLAPSLSSYKKTWELQRIQNEFQQGLRPTGCKRCWHDEESGLPSKRQLDYQYVFGNQHPDRSSTKILGMTFGNTCNLACVTCNSHNSSRWTQDEKKLQSKFPHIRIRGHDVHYRDPSFVQDLVDMCDDVVHIDIAGGEPFYASPKIHLEFLSKLRNPQNIKLHYTTNATVFPEQQFWDLWKNFRAIDIQLSLDGIGSRFEYLRYPANWQQVSGIVKQYQEMTHIQISISHTVSWINLPYVDEFMDWCEQQGLPEPYIGPVDRPLFLNPKCLPDHVKSRIKDKLEHDAREPVKNLIKFMCDGSIADQFEYGLNWVKELDSLRNLDFQRTFPELHGFIQNP